MTTRNKIIEAPNGKITSYQFTDENGNPAGGHTFGTGFTIAWQNGPLGRGSERQEPNGAFVEGMIHATIDRLEFYQEGKFKSEYNELAIRRLKEALAHLNDRTADREVRDVEGTHKE